MLRLLSIVSISVIILLMGCGGGESGPNLHPVTGTVTLDGQSIPEASIIFIDPTGKKKSYYANVKNGSFSSKMEAGKRKALITANRQSKNKMVDDAAGTGKEPAMEQYIPAKYNDKSTLEIEVASGNENQFTFDLTSK